MTCSLGKFTGGKLWIEMREKDNVEPRAVHWETKPNGVRVTGHLCSTCRQPLLFSPRTTTKREHGRETAGL